ncbi:hypothetical protein Aperf_G00000072854 [Anoplocephala perfoliata]
MEPIIGLFLLSSYNMNMLYHRQHPLSLIYRCHLITINAVDQDGRTALHHACSLQRVHLVCLLLRRQANHEIADKDGRRPIDVAIDTAHADIVTLLRLQPLHSDSKIMDPSSTGSGKDDTAIEVFRDFTVRAYHLKWDSEEEDYHDSPIQSSSYRF